MKTKSAKAKGRRLQQWVADRIALATGLESGKDKMIASREMGQAGTDVRLVGDAAKRFPFSIECKCQETWSVHKWIKQAKSNMFLGMPWLVFCKRNNEKPVVIMDADEFIMIAAGFIRSQGQL